jgi:hypothetical protein
MSVLSVMHKKYKEELKDDQDMKRLYDLLADAGIDNAFLLPEFVWTRWRLRLPSRQFLVSQFQLHAA